MLEYTLVVETVTLPALVIHGGAGNYLATTSAEQRRERGRRLADIARRAQACMTERARDGVMAAIGDLERDPLFNAGRGSRLQRDGVARMSVALADGAQQRTSAIYNVQDCLNPSELALALQDAGDRNLDSEGARRLMQTLGITPQDVRTPRAIERWRRLVELGETADREAAIGSAGAEAAERAMDAHLQLPADLEDDGKDNRFGTVGAVGCDVHGDIWACTSTGGRGHEPVGRVSDSATPAGNYACPRVAVSATGFGEQIIDLNVCGRIVTRMLDGADLARALHRTFGEVAAHGGLLGVIAIAADGTIGYAHTTEACGVAWCDARGNVHVDAHGR
ncbi:MAG: isoaspartyl peptidase/L-asparaginase [Myxococcales bacterium]|nr:isoaspartyl peptidase/L-asparaginase [Myxococcales bacterium]